MLLSSAGKDDLSLKAVLSAGQLFSLASGYSGIQEEATKGPCILVLPGDPCHLN